MKKKPIILIFVFCFTIVCFYKKAHTQNYCNLLETNKLWNYLDVYSGPNNNFTKYYKTSNDTNILGKNYSKIEISLDSIFWQSSNFFLREVVDSQKVYLRYNSNEGLIYDFNKNLNDTIVVNNKLHGNFPVNLVVLGIDSIQINGNYRKILYFDDEKQHFWITGIGDSYGIEYPGTTSTGFINSLVCHYKDNSFLYLNPLYSSCFYKIAGISNNSNSELEIQYINSNCLKIISNVLIRKVEIYNINGDCVLNKEYNSDNILIDIKYFSKGIYLLKANTEKNFLHKSIIKL